MLNKQLAKHFNKSTKKGFSLLDASILLIIFALVAISFLAVNSFENLYKQTKVDYKRIQNIKNKIEALKLKNSAGCKEGNCRYTVLPCPATGGTGEEVARQAEGCVGLTTKIKINNIDYYYYYGEIPYVTLGIAKEDAINRYGNFYGYLIPALGTRDFAPDGFANYKIFDTGDKTTASFSDFSNTNQFSDTTTVAESTSELCNIPENQLYEDKTHSIRTGIYKTISNGESLNITSYQCQADVLKQYVSDLTDDTFNASLDTVIKCFSGGSDF